jgi:Gpi18-like mannosyltransferase
MNNKYPLIATFMKWQRDNRSILLLLLVTYFLVALLVPDTTTPGKYDRRVWITWANYMLSNGLQNVYKLGVDYLPITHYILYGYTLLTGSTESIISNINTLKLFTFSIELLGVYYVYLFVKEKYLHPKQAALACLWILLNPAFLYDSLLYGQWDGIYTTLVFISFYYALKNRLVLSVLFVFIALNAKIQALVYMPILGFIWLENLVEDFNWKQLLRAALALLVVQTLIVLPFALTGDLQKVIDVGINMVGRYPLVSMGANNVWYFIFDNPSKVLDIHGAYGLSYNSYGLLFFCAMTFLTLLPFGVYFLWKMLKRNFGGKYPVENYLLMGILVPVVFFYFNTQMHGRYAHSAILFGGAYALYTRSYWIYIVLSIAYFNNLEIASKILKGDILEYQVFFMQPKFVAALFAVVILACLGLLYSSLVKTSKQQVGK